jgi:hypothetical protein
VCFIFQKKSAIFQEKKKQQQMTTPTENTAQESKNIAFEEVSKILENLFPKNVWKQEEDPCPEEKKQEQKPSTESVGTRELNEVLGSLKTLAENVLLEMDKLDQEELQNNQRNFPRFTKLYDSWEQPSKPKPHWDQVNALEVYLCSFENQDKSEVSRFFFSQTWRDVKDESYVPKVCAIVQKIFPHEFVGVQHSFAMLVVKHLQFALKPNLDNR